MVSAMGWMFSRSRRPTTNSAPKSPKIAPDAPSSPTYGRHQRVRKHRAGEPGKQVQRDESARGRAVPRAAVRRRTGPHVEQDVQKESAAGRRRLVQKHARQQAVVLASARRRRSGSRVPGNSTDLVEPVHERGRRDLAEEGETVQPDQCVRSGVRVGGDPPTEDRAGLPARCFSPAAHTRGTETPRRPGSCSQGRSTDRNAGN